MRGRLFLTVALVVAGVIVAAFNWDAMTQVVMIDLLFVTVSTTVGAIAALVAATLIAVFLLAGLLDRARHLQQLSHLERHLEDARSELDRKRSADFQTFAVEIGERLDELRSGVDGGLARVEDSLLARVGEVEADLAARVDALRDRVVVVRDELAADIAEVEDALLRRQDAGAGALEVPEQGRDADL
jgi:hypothetical protein